MCRRSFLTVGAMPIYSKLHLPLLCHWDNRAVQGNCGFIFGKYKLKCALLWRTLDFHHPNPLGIRVRCICRCWVWDQGKPFHDWVLKLSKKPCIWLFPGSWPYFKSVSRFFDWLEAFIVIFLPIGYRNCHKPLLWEQMLKILRGVWHIVCFW